jgi:hypothetical protein
MKLNFEIYRQDYADFNKFHFIKVRLKQTILTGTTVILVLQLFLNKDKFNLAATIVSSLVSVIIYFLIYYVLLNNTKNTPSDNGSILGHRYMEFTDNEVICNTDSSRTVSAWTTIKSFKKGRKSFYLYVDTNMAYIIPKRIFSSNEERENLSILLRVK